jgi:hypothetical protein
MRVIAGEQRDEDRPDEREDRDRLVRLQRRDDRPAAY